MAPDDALWLCSRLWSRFAFESASQNGLSNHGFCQVGCDVEAHGQVAKADLPEA